MSVEHDGRAGLIGQLGIRGETPPLINDFSDTMNNSHNGVGYVPEAEGGPGKLMPPNTTWQSVWVLWLYKALGRHQEVIQSTQQHKQLLGVYRRLRWSMFSSAFSDLDRPAEINANLFVLSGTTRSRTVEVGP